MCILSFRIFCSTLISSVFLYRLKTITSGTPEFYAIFIIRETTKKDGLKLGVAFFIKTTFIFMVDSIQKSLSTMYQIKKVNAKPGQKV